MIGKEDELKVRCYNSNRDKCQQRNRFPEHQFKGQASQCKGLGNQRSEPTEECKSRGYQISKVTEEFKGQGD